MDETRLSILENTENNDVQELVAEIRRLRARVAHLDNYDVEGAKSCERARIVAWLRSYDDVHRRSALADRIEKGEHEGTSTAGSAGSPRGQVPLSVNDTTAQDLLWEHAQRQRTVDAEFSDDLETALRSSGFDPTKPNGMKWEMAVVAADRAVQWACVLVDDIAGWSGTSGNWPLQSASGMLRGVVGLFASWAKGEYSTAICFECRSTWSGSSRSPTTPPPTCSQCGKPCIGGHWVEHHAP